MAWTLDNTTQGTYGTSDPNTVSHTCSSAAKVLVLAIFVNGTTARTGGAPTYNGVTMTDSGQGFVFLSGGEAGVELWYLLNPASGANTVSVPNTGSVSLDISVMSFEPSAGNQAAFDAANSATGDSATWSVSVTVSNNNCLMVGAVGSGERDVPSAGTNYTLVHTQDAGNQVWGSEYDLDAGTSGAITVDFSPVRADDWGLIGIGFYESTPSTVTGAAALTGTGSLSAIGKDVTIFTGVAPLSGTGTLSSVGSFFSIVGGVAPLSGTGTLSGAGYIVFPSEVTIQNNQGRLSFTDSAQAYAKATSNMIEQSNAELTAKFTFNDLLSGGLLRFHLRGSGDWADWETPTTAYEVEIANTNNWKVYRIQSGSRTQIGTTQTWTATTEQHSIKFQVVGTDIRAKVWRTIDAEPGWQQDIDDSVSGFTTAGILQLGYFRVAGSHYVDLDDVSVQSPEAVVFGVAALTGTGTLSTSGQVISFGTATLAGTGTLSAVPTVISSGVAALSGTGTLTSTGYALVSSAAALSGTGTLSTIGISIASSAATLSGTGTLTSIPFVISFGVATLSGTGTISAIGGKLVGIVTGAATLSGTGSLVVRPFPNIPLNNMALWLTFDDISDQFEDAAKTTRVDADSDPIGAILDNSGNGSDATQTNATRKPAFKTNVQNGLDGALFTESDVDHVATGDNVTLGQTFTVFAVAKETSGVQLQGVVMMDNSLVNQVRMFQLRYANSNQIEFIGFDDAVTANPFADQEPIDAPTNWHILEGVRRSTSVQAYADGYSGGSTATTGTPNSATDLVYVGVASRNGITLFDAFNGNIVEVIIYNAELTDAQREQVESYLSIKWAIPLVKSSAATLSGTGSLSAIGEVGGIQQGAATLTGTGSLTSAAYAVVPVAATLTGTGSLSTTAYAITSSAGALSGLGTLSAIGDRVLVGVANLSGTGTLSAIPQVFVVATASLTGTGTLTTAGYGIRFSAATMSGTGTLSAIGEVGGIISGVATLSGLGTLTAIPFVISYASSALSGAGTLSSTSLIIVPVTVTMSGAGTLSASAYALAFGAVPMTGTGTLSAIGAGIGIKTGVASLTGQGSLVADYRLWPFTDDYTFANDSVWDVSKWEVTEV